MLDGTYLSRNFATLGPLPDSRRVLVPNRRFTFGWCLTVNAGISYYIKVKLIPVTIISSVIEVVTGRIM